MFLEPKAFLLLACLSSGLLTGCSGTDSKGSGAPPVINEAPWPMHPVDSRFRGANALSPGDVDQDGFTDYVTNYEFDQRYVVSLHPGAGGEARRPWPTVVAWQPQPLANGAGVNPEHAALADFDGDGNLDIVAAQGWSELPFWEGSEPGIRLIWGPPAGSVLDEGAWSDGGRIPVTIDRGHFIFAAPSDVNGDGALDIVSGGRIHGGSGRKGGVVWIEAPASRQDRRDLSMWMIHDIDPDQFSAHGLVFSDVDEDGDADILLANADWDTPESEEKILWYENPGSGAPAQKEPWPVRLVYQGSEFFAKPQVAVADLDGDGLDDLLVQTDRDIYFFRKLGLDPVAWERIVIEKDPVARWLARPIRAADLNGDGRLDLIGMLVHEDGTLPGDKAAVFWMQYQGTQPLADNWVTRVIKWGSGRPMLLPIFGEKWDQVQIVDVDRDGDLDFVANCEEWWEDDLEFRFFWDPEVDPASVAVVWFENRLREEPYSFEEEKGLCVLEAEHFTDLKDGTWLKRARYADYGSDGYMQDHNALESRARAWHDTLGLEYGVHLKGGTYHIWVRRLAPSDWGFVLSGLGGARSDSAWLGANGEPLPVPLDEEAAGFDAWDWVRIPFPVDLPAGTNVLNLRVREGGCAVDRVVLATDPDFVPSGTGPEETLRGR